MQYMRAARLVSIHCANTHSVHLISVHVWGLLVGGSTEPALLACQVAAALTFRYGTPTGPSTVPQRDPQRYPTGPCKTWGIHSIAYFKQRMHMSMYILCLK